MCLEDNILLELSRGALPSDQREQAQQHLAACESCRLRLASLLPTQVEEGFGRARTRDFRSLGRYVVLDLLGAGGMGVVYSAYDPELDRKVALKLLRTDVSSSDASLRLLREAQAIARLSHPNVVNVYDVGTSGDVVFIAMELVKGGTLRQWLLAQERSWKEILKVFIEAGKGLAAAHAAGLVHRDFKPDNVLMGDDGRVRVTDFGLARSAALFGPENIESVIGEVQSSRARSALNTPLTEGRTLLGTPSYMAPEQLSGAMADAQCDQFSFCVSLYEALYRARPFEGRPVSGLRMQIEQGQILPVDKKTSVPAWLHRILIRGLSAKSQDRYPSMDALLSTLQADPDSARRKRLWVAGIAALAATSTLGFYAYARHLKPSCEQAAKALSGIWDNEHQAAIRHAFLASGKPFANDAWNQTSRDLDSYAEHWVRSRTLACRATQDKAELPDITALRALCFEDRLAELRATASLLLRPDAEVIAGSVTIAQRLSPIADCENLSSLAVRFRTPFDSATRSRVQGLRARLAEVAVQQRSGNYTQGLISATSVTEQARQLGYRPALADALVLQADLEDDSGDLKSAEKTCREAFRIAVEEGYERGAARAANLLVWIVGRQDNRPQEGHLWADQAAAHIVRLGGDELLNSEMLEHEGTLYAVEGQYERALDRLTQSLALREKILGLEHMTVALALNNISGVLVTMSRYSEAIERLRKAIEIAVKLLGPKNPKVGLLMGNLGASYLALQRFDEATPYLQQSLTVLQEALSPEHVDVAYPLLYLGTLAALEGRYAEGVTHLQRSRAIFEKALGPENPRVALPLDELGIISLNQGHFDDALRYHRRELDLFEKGEGLEHPDVIGPLVGMAGVYCEQHKYFEALKMLDRARAVAKKGLPPHHESIGLISDRYGQIWLAMGQPQRAISGFQQALEVSTKMFSESASQVGDRLAHLGTAYLHLGKPKLALPLLERANQIASSGRLDARQHALRQFALAKALWQNKRETKRAVELATRARQLLTQSQAARRGESKEIAAWLQAVTAR